MPDLGIGPTIHLTELLLTEIARIGELRAPSEACGVLLLHPKDPDRAESQVVEIPNRSMRPHDGYEMSTNDIRMELLEWLRDTDVEELGELSIWHTHPAGNIGPSAGDMRARDPGISYLVVALTQQGPVPTWF